MTVKDAITQTLRESTAAIRESAASANSNGSVTVMNLPHPTAFSGSDTNCAKRTSAFRTWRTQVTARWNALPGQFYSEKQKILYASTVLTGAAHDGVMAGVEKINKNPDDPSVWPWKTGEELMEHLAAKYATLDLAADAEIRLRKLEQSGKFAVFTDFLTELINLADICDLDDATRVRFLREKVSPDMRKMLSYQINLPDRVY